MAPITLGVWNVEWMNDLFEGDPPRFKSGDAVVRGPRRGGTVRERRRDIAGVIEALELDALVVVEGPNRVGELQLFFDTDVAGDWACALQPSGAQSVGLAVRTDGGAFDDPPFRWFDAKSADAAPALKAATDPFEMDTDEDGLDELHRFERRPLYAELRPQGGDPFRVLGVHLKSKGVFGAYEWSKWWARAEGNRKKLLAQCYRLRTEFLNVYLADPQTAAVPLLVCGDVNDGPGFDTSEMKLQASGIERLMGSVWASELCFGNALYDALPERDRAGMRFSGIYTASFEDPIFDGQYHRVWIDHVLYSKNRNGTAWVHSARVHRDMPPDDEKIWRAFPHASDHFPITCVVEP